MAPWINRRDTKKDRKAGSSLQNLFHGVEIVARGNFGCPQARQLEGRRFLSEEAPLLPLEGCSSPDRCACSYRHFSDRRTDKRRDSDLGLPDRPIPDDRRESGGRRITDW
ncbi:MAG: hypothetical protein V2I63_03280 [Pseudomonadales bacterium]|jgi:hypothetical protein|nr:hypothetical protein [Pseudomonadales bacterium]